MSADISVLVWSRRTPHGGVVKTLRPQRKPRPIRTFHKTGLTFLKRPMWQNRPPGHHQVRCLFSRERKPRYRRSISPDAAEHSVGTDSCGLQPGNDHKRFASGRMRDRFQLDFSTFDANRLIQCTKSIGILGEKFPL